MEVGNQNSWNCWSLIESDHFLVAESDKFYSRGLSRFGETHGIFRSQIPTLKASNNSHLNSTLSASEESRRFALSFRRNAENSGY
jgi:hypothetical protein